MQRERSAHEELAQDLADLTEDMAICLGWDRTDDEALLKEPAP